MPATTARDFAAAAALKSASDETLAAAPRDRIRSVRCSRCRHPLGYTASMSRRGATLFCNRCGAPTPAPTARMLLLKIATAILSVIALGIFAYAMTHRQPTATYDPLLIRAQAIE
jgi:hypothetical protein